MAQTHDRPLCYSECTEKLLQTHKEKLVINKFIISPNCSCFVANLALAVSNQYTAALLSPYRYKTATLKGFYVER